MLIVISACLLEENKVDFLQIQEEPYKNIKNYSSCEQDLIIEKSPDELKNSKCIELKNKLSLFYTFLKMETIYKPVIFIFLYTITPSYNDPLFFFYTNVLKFAPITIGRLKVVYGIATILGIWFYNKFLRTVGFKTIIWWTTILSMIFNMLSIVVVSRINLKIGIPDFWFCLTADALTNALGEINTMPLLVLACNICPKNIEGTLYAFLMSVLNLGGLFSNQFGSILTSMLGITSTNFTNLSLLIFIANIVLLVPMPALYLVNENAYVLQKDLITNEKNIESDDTIISSKIGYSNEEEKTEIIHKIIDDKKK